MSFKRWLYRDGRPHTLAKILNRGWAIIHSLGVAPNYLVTLEVVGRKSGRLTSFPLALIVLDGERYLVSMLGRDANWVHNIRAAGGQATLRHGKVEQVILKEVDPRLTAPILKTYLRRAPGARPHFPIGPDAPLAEFEQIRDSYPVFRVEKVGGEVR